MSQEIYLEIKIDRSKPIGLLELTDSLYSLAAFYKRFARNIEGEGEATLLVEEISKGSVVARLITKLELIPTLEDTKLIKYAKMLNSIIEILLKGENINDKKTKNDKLNYQDLSNLLNVVIDDEGGNIKITAQNGSNVVVNNYINHNQAHVIQNGIRKHIEGMEEPVIEQQTKEIFYWYQARGLDSTAGDKGVIERITQKPLPIIFVDDTIKNDMLHDQLFKQAYVVDVEVGTVEGKPASYKISRIHQKIERPLKELTKEDKDIYKDNFASPRLPSPRVGMDSGRGR